MTFPLFTTNATIDSKMCEEVDARPGASTSWREWVLTSTENVRRRNRSATLVVAILAFLWTLGPAFVEAGFSEDGIRQFQSIDLSISTADPIYAMASSLTDVGQSFGESPNSNISHELRQARDHVLRLYAQKNSGESTRMMLITGSDQAEDGYAVSCVDSILLRSLPRQPRSTSSWFTRLLGGLVCVVAAYLAIPYSIAANGVSDQQYDHTSTLATHTSAKTFAIKDGNSSLKSCPIFKASADGASKSSSKRMALPNAADAASIARKHSLIRPTFNEWQNMGDEDVVTKALEDKLALYSLEKVLGDSTRAVQVRRAMVARNPRTSSTTSKLETSGLPYINYDYDRVMGACCENVIGYLPLPVGVAGPLDINGSSFYLPMATTEGVLVASTNRGATAINASGGVTTTLLDDGMTRGPALRFPGLPRAAAFKHWLDTPQGYKVVESAFNSTSRFAKLRSVRVVVTGSDVFARFKATTGDAMGMNMISKGVEAALSAIALAGFADMQVISLSGNYCTDKKAAAINWIDGRGKSVCAEATIAADVLRRVMKTDVDTLVVLNTSKNLVGSAVAGAMGGFNAHAANIVTAIFLATGQDPAQNVESSGCLTTMKK